MTIFPLIFILFINNITDTYEEAQKRVQQLMTKPYACTTENDESAKIQKAKQKY